MNKHIKLISRYNNIDNDIELIDNNRGIFTTNAEYVSCATKDGKLVAIDPEGGPFVSISNRIGNYCDRKKTTTKSIRDKIIKSIKACYLIEFE